MKLSRLAAILITVLSGPVLAQDLEQAHALLEAGRFGEVQKRALAALNTSRDRRLSIEWQWLLALAYRGEGDHEQAATTLQKILETGMLPHAVEAALELARCYLEMWNATAAKKILDMPALRGAASYRQERQELLAITIFQAGDLEKAQKEFESLSPKKASAHYYLGLLAFNRGKHAPAIEQFSRACELDPRDYYSQLHRAWSLLELDRIEAARSALKTVLDLADTHEAYHLLGRVELRDGNHGDAVAHFRRALKRSPAYSEAQFGLATALRHLGKREEAKKAFEKFRLLHTRDQENMRRAYKLTHKHRNNPRDVATLEELARIQLERGDPGAAERAAWQGLTLEPARSSIRLTLARALVLEGRYGQAAIHYRRILQTQLQHPEARRELEELIRQHGRRVRRP